jgi:acyl-CoA reductase-like NAD-dependent aldehyde dehydrogenase
MVQKGIYNKFADALTARIKELKVGKGTEEGVFIGPLTHERAVEKAMVHINGELGSRERSTSMGHCPSTRASCNMSALAYPYLCLVVYNTDRV